MAPRPDGSLYISIPRPGGAVLALLDRDGRLLPGWPITIKHSTSCGTPLPVDDGSVRIACDGTDLPRFENDVSDMRVFAFDARGRSMPGWPVELRPGSTSIRGDRLSVLSGQILTDVVPTGRVSWEAWVTTIAADGKVRHGEKVPMVETCCVGASALASDGVAYRVESVGDWVRDAPETSRIIAFGRSGRRAGWPIEIDGIPSEPAFGPDGRIVVTVGSTPRGTSRVLAFDRDGGSVAAKSPTLAIVTGLVAYADGAYECGQPRPRAPLVAPDGTVFVDSEADSKVYAVDPSLEVIRGWPFEPGTPFERRHSGRGGDGIDCPSVARPAVGPDSALYMPLQGRDSTLGGELLAVGRDGRVRAGWPVTLTRPGAAFWSVVVGNDGTAYALAIEPEAGDRSSASILAIEPDSTVRYTTTIIDP
jgi:hypothetical protein